MKILSQIVLAVVLVLSMSCVGQAAEGDSLKMVKTGRSITNVFVNTSHGWTNLTHFKNPHHIYDFGASPDGKYVYVFHMDFRPVKISVFETGTGKRVSQFSPGVSGRFSWGDANRIIMQYGAGTDGHFVTVFGLDGTVVYNAYGNTELWENAYVSVNPSAEFIVLIPLHKHLPAKVEIVRVRDGAIWYYDKEEVTGLDFKWLNQHQLEITLAGRSDEPGKPLLIEVKKYTEAKKPDRQFVLKP